MTDRSPAIAPATARALCADPYLGLPADEFDGLEGAPAGARVAHWEGWTLVADGPNGDVEAYHEANDWRSIAYGRDERWTD